METGPLRDCGHRVFRVDLHVGDMNRFAFQQNPTRNRASAWLEWMIWHVRAVLVRDATSSDVEKADALRAANRYHIRVAESRDCLEQRIGHRLQIEGRAADDLQHVR